MRSTITLDINQLKEFLLAVAPVRPVFIWGPPGIGKSSVINQFSAELGMECVSLLGSQLASEDLIGIPQIQGNVSRFVPPSLIVRDVEYCLFIDELNIASSEVQKAFYSLILDKRVGEYHLPKGSIVVGAGNRAADSSLVKQLPAALINRMIHIHLKVNHKLWLNWANNNEVHPWVIEYIQNRPTQLSTEIAPTNEEPFSSPRSWEAISDGLKEIEKVENNEMLLDALLFGSLTNEHAIQFKAFIKQLNYRYSIPKLLKGETKWPDSLKDRDVLLFLVYSVRDYLIKELPKNDDNINGEKKKLVIDVKESLKKLTHIDNEYAQHILSPTESGESLPVWFLTEVTKELPRLLMKTQPIK
jgi:hypothetical protein